MRVLVTGGAGFVGASVVDVLVEAGHKVLVIDNMATGKDENLNPVAEYVNLDLRDGDLDETMRRFKPDVIQHMAAQASVPGSVERPDYDAMVNIVGSVRLLEAARKANVRKIVYAASGGSMYGVPTYLPIDEGHPIAPVSPYAISKHTVEHYLEAYQHLYGMAYTSLRYANIYGPRQDPRGEAGVVSIFANRMLEGTQPVIHGDGLDERDYIYVGDVAHANLLAIDRADGEAINIGTGIGTNVNQIFDALKQLTGFAGERVHGPPRLGDIPSMRLEPRRAGDVLGWRAIVPFDEGLARTVEWFRKSKRD